MAVHATNVNDIPSLGEPKRHSIRFPITEDDPDQDREWCQVLLDGKWERIRFHDYHRIYDIPHLYEDLFYRTLRCTSPRKVTWLLQRVLGEHDESVDDLRVFDVGAGNGLVGKALQRRGADTIVGADIIPEARQAALRDRPSVYDDYVVADLCDLPEKQEETLRRMKLNCVSCVAALGFGDVPPLAFIRAIDLIETPGWLAFNIKEDFLREKDDSGFSKLVRRMARDRVIQQQAYYRYRHRLSIGGEPLHYVAMIAKKLRDVPDPLREEFGGR